VASVDADDLKPSATEAFEALLRKAYTRLGKREGKTHRIYDFPPEKPGDPDQLERVTERLDKELPTRFKPGEASVAYAKDAVVLRLPARL